MGKPAARIIADKHACIANTAGTPHVGGPILPMGPFVVIGGYPAARVGDKCTCATGPPATIVTGSQTVLIGGKQAARMGDPTSHGGAIATGFLTGLIGG